MKQLYLDLDGVIINFHDGVKGWYGLELTKEQESQWDGLSEAAEKQLGLTVSEFWSGLDRDFWVHYLKKYPWADIVLALVEPYKPILLTAPAWHTAGYRQDWIQNNLPKYFHSGRYVISPKKGHIATPGDVLIDDAEHNISDWNIHGGTGILFPQSWNENKGKEPVEYLYQQLQLYFGEDF